MPTAVNQRVVWVVDDSRLDAERAKQVLGDECRVEVFADGSAALERLASTAGTSATPDAMVLDWVMPGVTGLDVCRFMRSADGGYAQVGILLLTTHRNTEQIVEGLSAGANDYLAKPYADAELLARVRALLRTRQLLERATRAEAVSVKLLQLTPDGLIALDEHRRIKFVNDTARTALEREHRINFEGAPPLSEVLPDLDRRLQSQNANHTLPLPDIQIGERLFSPTIRSLPAGDLFSSILSLRDVTESRRAAARRLDFYSIIAHDLRTPLSTLTLRTQLMLSGKHGELPAGMQADLLKTNANLKSLVEMINDFLDLARLDQAAYELKSDEVDVVALLTDTMENLQPQLATRDLRWVSQTRDAACVIGDARRLQQVFTNLIGNAIKFTDVGGTITTNIISDGHEIEVSVADNGRGIPAQSLPTIFDRYTRAANNADNVAGSGLGLMIVREIIEAHGGRIGVESTVGVGSRFWFRLPTARVSK
jgi:two-component system phosphate regulon sensor histidine kinase PhoR